MPVKIKKSWDNLAEQRVFAGDKAWLITDLIEHGKDLPVMDIPMEHLCFDSEIATIAGISIREFVGHMKMILDIDTSHPIIMDEDGGIFDGRHRIARALLDEVDSIKAIRFEKDPPPTYTRSED